MRTISGFPVLQQLGTMLKSRPVLTLEAIRISVVCAAAPTSTILVFLARSALEGHVAAEGYDGVCDLYC